MNKGKREFKFYRDCKLCKTHFGTNRDWQVFCTTKDPLCNDEYWKKKRRVSSNLQKKVENLEKKIEKLEKKKGASDPR